ncbi:PAS domain-containing protein [Rhodobacter sp. NSM]|uniref:PAS domain-containing protein n=1 Tax=Rhodobacter sp. NSM TaxID=3457501 RepID=UPI003FD0F731
MAEGTAEDCHPDICDARLGIGRWRWELRSQTMMWCPVQRTIHALAPSEPVPEMLAFFQMIHPDDRHRVMASVSETVARCAETYSQTYRIVHPGGAVRHILSRGRLVRGKDGEPLSLDGIDIDLTDSFSDAGAERPRGAHVPLPSELAARDEQDALLRVALEAGRMTVWQLDLKRRVVLVGGDVARLFGVADLPREIPAALFESYVDAEDLPHLKAAEAAALRGEPMQVEVRIVLVDGGRRWLRLMGDTRLDGAGQPQRIVGVAYDVSARKATEALLRQSEQHYRDVFAAIDEGFCTCEIITDPAGGPIDYRFLEANPLFQQMTGLSNPVGRTARELVPGLERHWIDTYARVGLGRETLRFELPSDAMGRWFNVFATPLSVPGRFALVFKDVTESRQGQEALRESEAMFRGVTEAMPQVVWSTRADGYLDFLNQQWTDLTGATADAARGEDWRSFFHPDDQPAIDRLWTHAIRTGEPYEIEYRLRHRDGQYRWVLGRGVPVRDGAGRILRWMGTCTDIHDLKLAQQRQQLLREEMEHRVKNILALVQAVARQTFGGIPEADAARAAFNGRLHALAGAYGRLNHENWSRASLRHIIETSVAGGGAREGAAVLEGPDVMLPPKSAVPLSMALHELCTNATKYGALSTPDGRVVIRWDVTPDERLHLVWSEEDGPPVAPPSRSGFGMRMIEKVLAAEVEGTVRLDFLAEGVRCEMDMSISQPEDRSG